jgi:hypothetical protein
MNNDFYSQFVGGVGVNLGSVLAQAHGEIGGSKHVFVKLQGSGKNGLVFPTSGGHLVNPFKGVAKGYAGDLVEYSTDGKCKILKVYEVAVNAEADATVISLVRDGYHHKPFVGDVIMIAPDTASGTGVAATITKVERGTGVWNITISAAIGAAQKGAVLVEGVEAGNAVSPVVTNPNAFLACDYDFAFYNDDAEDDFDKAKYLIAPCLANEDTKLIESQVTIPPYVKTMNRSRVVGWFNL